MFNTHRTVKFLVICFIALLTSSFISKEEGAKVLIIGDSISIGYTPFVQKILKGKATVIRPMKSDGSAENCQGTSNGVKNVERWIGEQKWDVIHFNFGLHDLKHVDPITKKTSNKASDPFQADTIQYEQNLLEIIAKLRNTNASLIFATTTPYPPTAVRPLRDPGMAEVYNRVALKVMNQQGIKVNDLYSFVLPRMSKLQRPDNVHFTELGSKTLAKKVAESILASLTNK